MSTTTPTNQSTSTYNTSDESESDYYYPSDEEFVRKLKEDIEHSNKGLDNYVQDAKKLQIYRIKHIYPFKKSVVDEQYNLKSNLSLGSVILSKIKFATKVRKEELLANKDTKHYFFCIIRCFDLFRFTDTISTMDMVKQNNENCLLFNDKVTFHDLKPNFKIDLMAYELTLENVSLKGKNKKHRELFTYIGKAEFNLGDRDKNYKTFTNYSTFGGSKLIPGWI